MKSFSFLLILIIIAMDTAGHKGFCESSEVNLPSPKRGGEVSLENALDQRESTRNYSGAPLKLEEVSQILWAAYGKNKYDKLTVPSAGALYPLTIYLVAANVEKLGAGFYQYSNSKHSLKLISKEDLRFALSKAALNQPWVKEAPALIIICADYDITASSYGKRAQRYVDIEVGHVGENIYLEVTALGLGTVAVGAFHDEEVKEILKVKEDPVYIMPVGRLR